MAVAKRVAALYDIHGNLPALEAVLPEVERAGADLVVVGGDVVTGPMPRETLDRLLVLPIPALFVRGNADREAAELAAGGGTDDLPRDVREATEWVSRRLGPERLTRLSGWPLTVGGEIAGLGRVLFCHATPRSDAEVFTQLTPDERLEPAFAGVGAPLVVCGHTHMPFDRTVGGVRVVNAGSVGMPYGEPGAHWLLLGPGVESRRTPYDLDAAAARVRATGFPQAEDFAANNVLRPPSEAEALRVFTEMESERRS